MCYIELSNPDFDGIATQELKIILNGRLEKGKKIDQIFSLLNKQNHEILHLT